MSSTDDFDSAALHLDDLRSEFEKRLREIVKLGGDLNEAVKLQAEAGRFNAADVKSEAFADSWQNLYDRAEALIGEMF